MTLTEKLENLKILDNEIIDMTDDEAAIADEIKQSDEYKEAMYAAMIRYFTKKFQTIFHALLNASV